MAANQSNSTTKLSVKSLIHPASRQCFSESPTKSIKINKSKKSTTQGIEVTFEHLKQSLDPSVLKSAQRKSVTHTHMSTPKRSKKQLTKLTRTFDPCFQIVFDRAHTAKLLQSSPPKLNYCSCAAALGISKPVSQVTLAHQVHFHYRTTKCF